MARSGTIFHKLVTDENSTTELLCNLMRFSTFRRAILPVLLDNTLAEDITFEQIETQADLAGAGQADLLVRTESFCAILEVKATSWRSLTEAQERHYVTYLAAQPQPYRSLAFLIPNDWMHVSALEQIFETTRSSIPEVHTHIAYWTEVLDVIERRSTFTR